MYVFCYGMYCNRRLLNISVPSVDVEPVPQLRTLIGTHTAEVGTCPVGTCRYDIRRHEGCSDDGFICPVTEEREFDVGDFGTHMVRVVTGCKCCKDEGITIRGSVVDAATGAPLPDVELHITLESSASSDSDGSFSLNVGSGSTRVVVNADLTGYMSAMKVVEITKDFRGPYDTVVAMVEIATPVDIDSTVDNELAVSSDPSNPEATRASILISAGSFRTQSGDEYNGIVQISVNFIDTSDSDVEEEIPGIFLTADGQPLQTDGIFALNYESDQGEPLSMGQVTVLVSSDMNIWLLNSNGLWEQTGLEQTRRKRQTGTARAIIALIQSGRWVNIDKIPRAPRCYFKGRVFEEITGDEITSSTTASFRPSIISYRVAQNQRLRFYARSTRDPNTTCHEVRCLPNNALVGLITLQSNGHVPINGVLFPSVATLRPRNLPDYSQFSSLLPTNLGDVSYTALPSKELLVNFTSSVDGPFYTDRTTCEQSTINEPSFHFLLPPLPSYIPHPDDPICTARIGFYDNFNFQNTLEQLGSLPVVTAISTWSTGADIFYYTDVTTMEFSNIGGNFFFACIQYRCSSADASTTVSLNFGTPTLTYNRTRGNQTFQFQEPAFTCKGNCSTGNCFQNGGDVPPGGITATVDGSFVAPLNISTDGPDYYDESPNECSVRARNERFSALYHCYGNRGFPEDPEGPEEGPEEVPSEIPPEGVPQGAVA